MQNNQQEEGPAKDKYDALHDGVVKTDNGVMKLVEMNNVMDNWVKPRLWTLIENARSFLTQYDQKPFVYFCEVKCTAIDRD